jgi:hypothetical protein
MRSAWFGCLLWLASSPLSAGNAGKDLNVNCRYTVESVELAGEGEDRVSSGLRRQMAELIGEKFNPGALEDVARRIRKELQVRSVTHRVMRGTTPEHVKVVFETTGRPAKFDVSIPKFLYHAKQGWSAAVEGTATVADNSFTFGLISDGDALPERYAGLLARYEHRNIGTERVRLGFQFESYHQQWNQATRMALEEPGAQAATSGIYRTRHNFEPIATFVLARPLTLSVGAGFQRLQVQFPAAHTEASNAVVTTLRYHDSLEGTEYQHNLDAGYHLRAATKVLDSDFVYVRHLWEVRYSLAHGRHLLIEEMRAGLIAGRAPLFERFVLGTSSTLRGWNKFDLDPLGGNRVAHNTVEYRYRFFQVFYDTGAVWNQGQPAAARHAAGVGLREGGFSLAVAFPLRSGRAEPIFMVGMNY